MIKIETKHFTRINKKQARNIFNNGGNVAITPWKLNPENNYCSPFTLNKNFTNFNSFDSACNYIEYYNCNNETGKYLAFYIMHDM